jgi:hypothetical protein
MTSGWLYFLIIGALAGWLAGWEVDARTWLWALRRHRHRSDRRGYRRIRVWRTWAIVV